MISWFIMAFRLAQLVQAFHWGAASTAKPAKDSSCVKQKLHCNINAGKMRLNSWPDPMPQLTMIPGIGQWSRRRGCQPAASKKLPRGATREKSIWKGKDWEGRARESTEREGAERERATRKGAESNSAERGGEKATGEISACAEGATERTTGTAPRFSCQSGAHWRWEGSGGSTSSSASSGKTRSSCNEWSCTRSKDEAISLKWSQTSRWRCRNNRQSPCGPILGTCWAWGRDSSVSGGPKATQSPSHTQEAAQSSTEKSYRKASTFCTSFNASHASGSVSGEETAWDQAAVAEGNSASHGSHHATPGATRSSGASWCLCLAWAAWPSNGSNDSENSIDSHDTCTSTGGLPFLLRMKMDRDG